MRSDEPSFVVTPLMIPDVFRALQQLGYAVRLFEDGSTIVDPKTIKEGRGEGERGSLTWLGPQVSAI